VIVVADSGPPHYLILLDQVDLLHRFYGRVLVPVAVFRELSSGSAPKKVTDWLATVPAWFRVEPVTLERVAGVTQSLDLGEREAIALAQAMRADLLLIDDLEGRAEARRRNLRVTGTLGVLRAAAEQALIDVPTVIANPQQTNFYFDENLIRSVFGQWLSVNPQT